MRRRTKKRKATRDKRIILCLMVLLAVGAGVLAWKKTGNQNLSADILSWPNADAQVFSCWLEQEFDYRDPQFPCGVPLKQMGNACDPGDTYYNGPSFPTDKVKLIHPHAQAIELHWEGGRLQNVTVQFDPDYPDTELQEILGASSSVNTITASKISGNTISLTGFDPMVADDLDCDTPQE